MRFLLFLSAMLLATACMSDPELKEPEAKTANTQIMKNKSEAELAQKEYLLLQKERSMQ
ncbi:MAG: hypothetical protein PHS85_08340 [Sulfurovum sp.]|nr:hypothetical protein [Sulfurovum sp.]